MRKVATAIALVTVVLSGCAQAPAGQAARPVVQASATPSGSVAQSATPSPVASPANTSNPAATGSPTTTADPGHPITPTPTPPPSSTPPGDELKGLAPLLAQRFRAAQAGAAAEGVTLTLTSGYRSAADQQAIFDEKVREYGSVEEAAKWALPPDKSQHVKGMAIDVGPTITEMTWLEQNQASYGLCRMYANEPWHYELSYPDGSCPAMKTSAADA